MVVQTVKTFWDIEKEKTWRIYAVFSFLLLIHFLGIWILWLILKLIFINRPYLTWQAMKFSLFDWDTVIVLLIALIVTWFHWYHSNKVVVDKILGCLGVRHPDQHDEYHHVFENVVDELQAATGGLQVERYVIPTGAMNAFALADLRGRMVIGVTEGLISRLKREELQSVVAHEMAHIVSGDCLLTTIVCSLFNVYEEALARIPQVSSLDQDELAGRRPSSAVAASLPVLLALFVFECLGSFLNMFISREKEYRADAAAARLSRDPMSLASALYKIALHWRGAGYSGDRLSAIFIMSPEHNLLEESEGFWPTLFSTHPPFTKRLQVLLDLGHGEISQLTEQIQKKITVKTEPDVAETGPAFYAERNDEWYGPFSMFQLQGLDWIVPETRLRMDGSTEVVSALEVPALAFFFEARKEPMWKIRRLCPLCRQWLIVQPYEGMYVSECAFCRGILVERDKIPRIITRKEKGFSERVQRMADVIRRQSREHGYKCELRIATAQPRNCPKCGKPMVHKFYSYAYHVEIDECLECGLIWFDADELEILQCMTEIEEGER
jgi:heat shock protein HtpX